MDNILRVGVDDLISSAGGHHSLLGLGFGERLIAGILVEIRNVLVNFLGLMKSEVVYDVKLMSCLDR